LKRKYAIAIAICAGLFVALVVAALYSGLVVRRYTVESDKLGQGASIRAVLITDLHSHIYGKNQKDLLSLISRQKPDLVLLAGDIADVEAPFTGAELFIEGATKIAPVYYVSGNHEVDSPSFGFIKRTIRSYGVTVLESSYVKVKAGNTPVIIAGVDDPDIEMFDQGIDWESSMYQAFSHLDEEQGYKILLAHRTELIDVYGQYGFDLVVSGHAHGGQVRIPFILNGLYSTGEGWFPKHAGGAYKYGDLTHIVSRGIANTILLPRIFDPPEVVVIDIKGN
jgi:predicted MPP superfamily phosphohydrolase